MSEDNEDTTGYVLASDYAEQKNMPVEEVTERIRNGTLEGRIINDRWYLKEIIKTAEEIAVERRANIEASAKAGKDFMKSIKPVQVVSIDIPFGDIFWLTLKAFGASILIAIPTALLLALINS